MQIKNERNDLLFNQPLFGQPASQTGSSTSQGSQQLASSLQSDSNQNNSSTLKPTPEESEHLKYSEDQIDIESIKGRFGWTEVGGANIPYLLRKEQKYVSVRIVEQRLLSKYPNCYPDVLKKRPPLESHFVTPSEAKLLNEINFSHCGGEYGRKEFSKSDLIVLLSDFIDFLDFVQKTFPEKSKQGSGQQSLSLVQKSDQTLDTAIKETCGWLQVNNTVTPYLTRLNAKFVPLSIMKYAAKINTQDKGVLPTTEECNLLNKMCEAAGFRFTFINTTRITSLSLIRSLFSVRIKELPSDNPLGHVKYVVVPTSPLNGQMPNQQTASTTAQGTIVSKGPPSTAHNNASSNNRTSEINTNSVTQQTLNNHQVQTLNNVPKGTASQQPVSIGYPVTDSGHHQNKTNSNNELIQTAQSQIGNLTQIVNSQRMPTSGLPQQFNSVLTPGMGYGTMHPSYINPLGFMLPNMGLPYDVLSRQYLGANVRPQSSSINLNRQPPPYNLYNYNNQLVLDMSKRQPFPNVSSPSITQLQQTSRNNVIPSSSTQLQQTSRNNVISSSSTFSVFQNNSSSVAGRSDSSILQNADKGRSQMTTKTPGTITSSSVPNTYVVPVGGSSNVNVSQGGIRNIAQPAMKQQTLTQCFAKTSNVQTADAQSLLINNPGTNRLENTNVQTGTFPKVTVTKTLCNNTSNKISPNVPRMGNIPQTVANALKEALNKRKVDTINVLKHTDSVSDSMPKITPSTSSAPSVQPHPNVAIQSSNNSQTTLTNSIKVEVIAGKSISCIHRNNVEPKGKFCLVEVICRLYFNGCCVNEFLFTLENVFNVHVVCCTEEEEKAFIQYYSLHVTALKCNKLMNADDLERYFPQLSYVFKDSKSEQKSQPDTSNQQTITNRGTNQSSEANQPVTLSNKRPADSPPSRPGKIQCIREDKSYQRSNQNSTPQGQKQSVVTQEDDFSIIILDD